MTVRVRAGRRLCHSMLAIAAFTAVLWPFASVARAEPPSLMLLGDSITFGIVSAPQGPSFATLLEKAGFEVSNVACGGATTQHWHPDSTLPLVTCPAKVNLYADRALPALPAGIATVLLGGVDAVTLVPTREYAERLSDISNQLRRDGARAIILMTAPHNYKLMDPAVDLRLAEYRERVLAACSADPRDFLTCGPDLYLLLGPEHFSAGDGIHPNDLGHRRIFDALSPQLVGEPSKSLGGLAAFCALLGLARRQKLLGNRTQTTTPFSRNAAIRLSSQPSSSSTSSVC